MPHQPSIPSNHTSSGTTFWSVSNDDSGLSGLDGAAFDEAGLKTMQRALNDVCTEVAPNAAPAEREFIAWLIVRLFCRGVKDDSLLKSAALAALRWRGPHGFAT
jgi:hypothetical protein